MRVYLLFLSLLFLGSNSFAQEAPPASGEPLMHSIYFGGGDYYIFQQEEQSLSDFLKSIPDIESYVISIQSHTDDIGSMEYNQWLSEMRSRATYYKLLELGISEDQLIIEDYGETSPVFDNDTWEGKLRNRRVDVVLMKPQV